MVLGLQTQLLADQPSRLRDEAHCVDLMLSSYGNLLVRAMLRLPTQLLTKDHCKFETLLEEVGGVGAANKIVG